MLGKFGQRWHTELAVVEESGDSCRHLWSQCCCTACYTCRHVTALHSYKVYAVVFPTALLALVSHQGPLLRQRLHSHHSWMQPWVRHHVLLSSLLTLLLVTHAQEEDLSTLFTAGQNLRLRAAGLCTVGLASKLQTVKCPLPCEVFCCTTVLQHGLDQPLPDREAIQHTLSKVC